MAGSFEAVGRLERNIIDLYKHENYQASSAVESGLVRVVRKRLGMVSENPTLNPILLATCVECEGNETVPVEW